MKKKLLFLFTLLITIIILPNNVFATTEAEIKEKKEAVINSIPPTNEDEYYQLNDYLIETYGYYTKDCNASYTTCAFTKSVIVDESTGESHEEIIATNVTIKYEYDKDVKKVVDGILSKLQDETKTFHIEDVHAIKWVIDEAKLNEVKEQNDGINPIKYSPEFNSFIGYNNFAFEPRMGDDTMYAHFSEGTFQFKYNGTVYGYGHMATRVDQVVYVNNNETDIIGALKTRLSKYFDIKDIVKDDTTVNEVFETNFDEEYYRESFNECVIKGNDVNTLQQALTDLQNEKTTIEGELETLNAVPEADRDEEWNNTIFTKNERLNDINDNLIPTKTTELNNARDSFNNSCSILDEYETADDYVEAMRDMETDVNSEDALWNKVSKALPNVYVIKLNGDLISSGIPVFVIKDSSKVFSDDLEVKTRDVKSGVTINNTGTSKTLPFDTLVQVSKLTSGTDYNKIVNTLDKLINKDNIDMFDLKLFSSAIENYITKLDDGSFEVRIPLSDKLKNETNLIAYYVDDNNKVVEYPVKIEVVDGVKYGVFTTDHFSIYTLSGKEEEPEQVFKLTYKFNGGNRQGESEYVDESVAVGLDITKANFIDNMTVTPPEGKELDAIEINGTRTELGESYMLNKDTVFKYLWKDIDGKEETTLPDEKTNNKGETVPKTFDNVNTYIIISIISAVILIGTIVVIITRKKLIKNK